MDIIDKAKLNALYGHEETALDIIHMYVDQAPDFIKELETAMNDQDTSILAKVCHKGVGQARYIASPLIEETLIDLQRAPADKKQVYFNQLKSTIGALMDEYK